MTVYAREPHPATDTVGRGPGTEQWWATLPASYPPVAALDDPPIRVVAVRGEQTHREHHASAVRRAKVARLRARAYRGSAIGFPLTQAQRAHNAEDFERDAAGFDDVAARHLYLAQLAAALEDVTR